MPIEKTPNEIRIRVKSPDLFRAGSFRYKKLSGVKGVSIIIGKLKKPNLKTAQNKNSMVTQSYRFDNKIWTMPKARSWFNKHVKDTYSLKVKDRQIKTHNSQIGLLQVADALMDSVETMSIADIVGKFQSKHLKDQDSKAKKIIKYKGIPVYLENVKGDVRFPNIPSKPLAAHYGYIKDYSGNDGDSLDVYVGPNLFSTKVFKITQQHEDGSYDEDKYCIGFNSIEEAKIAYLASMPENLFNKIESSSLEDMRIHKKTTNLYDAVITTINIKSSIIEAITDEIGNVVKARILVTQGDIENLNNRQYTPESLAQAVIEAQENVRLGLLVGYEHHPDPVFNEEGEPVGYDYGQNPPLFRITKLWYDELEKQVWAEAIFFDTPLGIQYSNRIRSGARVSVSLRALGECDELPDGSKICVVKRIDGFDAVPNPALPDAKVIEYAEILDSVETVENIEIIPENNKKILDSISDDMVITEGKQPQCCCSTP